jgi:hypothetical protein
VSGLDWKVVRERLGGGVDVPTLAGGKTLRVVGVDVDGIHIAHPLWKDALERRHLERAVELVEAGRLSRAAGPFVEEYRAIVADVRATSVAHILRYLGHLS